MTKDQILKAEIVDDRLVISIGISALAFAAAHSPDLQMVDGEGELVGPAVTDEAKFAAEVLQALDYEEEDGTTLVHMMLDKAAVRAVENGADGIRFPSQQPAPKQVKHVTA